MLWCLSTRKYNTFCFKSVKLLQMVMLFEHTNDNITDTETCPLILAICLINPMC